MKSKENHAMNLHLVQLVHKEVEAIISTNKKYYRFF